MPKQEKKRQESEKKLREDFPKKLKYLFGTIDYLRHGQGKVSVHEPVTRDYLKPRFKYPDNLKTFYDQTNKKVNEGRNGIYDKEKLCRDKEIKNLETVGPIEVQTIQRLDYRPFNIQTSDKKPENFKQKFKGQDNLGGPFAANSMYRSTYFDKETGEALNLKQPVYPIY